MSGGGGRVWKFAFARGIAWIESICRQISRKIMIKNSTADIVFAFGLHPALRCTACSKRSKERCNNPAVSGFTVCRMHGARGGPRTKEGVDRIAMANTLHGRETRAKRLTRQEIRDRLNTAIALGEKIGMFDLKSTKGMKGTG
jgi:hypothetical protein